ncbi:MAG TPA: hypothetical protein PKM25_12450, partial [Candidatus Ozemobacteraceae bacterium]|nr:hypothetical protein [Candidatus Ozemobacteraceae bacterium]
ESWVRDRLPFWSSPRNMRAAILQASVRSRDASLCMPARDVPIPAAEAGPGERFSPDGAFMEWVV